MDESVPEVDVHALEVELGRGATVIDVREPHELVESRIAGVMPMPLDSVPDRVTQLPGDRPVYVVCAIGARSLRAAEFLRQRSIDAINVAGGTKGWVQAGKPYETG